MGGSGRPPSPPRCAVAKLELGLRRGFRRGFLDMQSGRMLSSACMGETPERATAVGLGLVAVFAALAVWLAWESLPWPLVHDAPIMHYIAWRISEGAVPYRDLFDMNFPGVYLIHLGVLTTIGGGDFGWRLFDLAWLAATALAMASFARSWGATAARGSGALFAVFHIAGGAWLTGQRDYLLCLFLVVGALGVARWAEGAGAVDLTW